MREFRRRLPHLYPEGKWLFVTGHSLGSLRSARYPPAGKMTAGEAFIWMDRYLDTTRLGPMFLREAEVVRIVLTSLKRGVEFGHYELRAHSIMANHVHALLHPKVLPITVTPVFEGRNGARREPAFEPYPGAVLAG